jgi:signal transduction histidine kinase
MRAYRLDVLLAAAVLAEALVELALLVPHPPHAGLAVAALATIATGVALRRRAPLACLLLIFGGACVLQSMRAYTDNMYLPFFTVFIASYSLGAYAERRSLIVGLVLGFFLSITMTLVDNDTDVSSYVFSTVVILLGPALIGRQLRHHAGLSRTLRERAASLERRRENEAERAVIDERTRIAGELDDVVAHALSAMTVQASAARRLVVADPARAREAFATVEETGRDALDELRRLLGVLRRDDEELALAPQPSLRHAAALVRRAGFPVELSTDGDPCDLPAGLDLTAYRVLQEALASAARSHAGQAFVHLRYGPDAVEVDVRDDAPAGPERELVGIGERVALYGGRLTSEPGRVRARIPRTAA